MVTYFVVGEDNLTSWSDKSDTAERFKSAKAAKARAAELAESEPGKMFNICIAVQDVICPVGKPVFKEPV